LRHTRLYDFHVNKGAKMVEFAGWNMPVVYNNMTISESHLYTRLEKASMFDVSHMLQTKVSGKDRIEFFESLIVGDLQGLATDHSLLTLFTNDEGGIIDDLVVTKTSQDYLYVVSNAGCSEKDHKHLEEECAKFAAKGKEVKVETIENSLVAVQGPQAAVTLQPHVNSDLSTLSFMSSRLVTLFDVPNVRLTRCGYTGEDGFEISLPMDMTVYVCEQLLEINNEIIKLAGLGARDTLRLEAGLCLYGNDIDEKTTPVEAGLAWTIGKRRRELADFPGAPLILKQLKDKPHRKRVGIISHEAPIRADNLVYDGSGTSLVGKLTSGCPSPSLKKNIAVGYVDIGSSEIGTEVKVEVRKHQVEAVIAKMPFIPTNYYHAPKK
ncbi:hypothetical protein HELRODRAFT_81738, partial [Helobdella robusta]|uniref:Aminomethyltransferase n=1 Tax=Helobdella robusta TaxID=6412 RepID=T1G4I2_HELRO